MCVSMSRNLIQTNVSNKFDKTGECLLANVYDIRVGNLEILTRQLQSKWHGDAQISVSVVIKATGSLIQDGSRGAHRIAGATIFGNLIGSTYSNGI